jgi:peptidoglycan/xylan/chitin deacetylase (PgdA/CDA1 family)
MADAAGLARLVDLARGWKGLLVLNYHRVGRPGESLFDNDIWSATAEDFDQQVRFVKKNFDVIGLGDLDDLLVHRRRHRAIMLTFDDGYLDNYELAYPVLRAHNATAVFFVTTGFLDHRNLAWWDEIAWMVKSSSHAAMESSPWLGDSLSLSPENQGAVIGRLLRTYKALPAGQTASFLDFIADKTGSGRCPASVAEGIWMTWDQIREMSAGGMGIGSHTVTHPILSRVGDEQLRHELRESKARLEAELAIPIESISYPVGQPDSFNAACWQVAEELGYRWAFSYYGGFVPELGNRFDIKRTAIELDCSLPTFRSMTRVPTVFHS